MLLPEAEVLGVLRLERHAQRRLDNPLEQIRQRVGVVAEPDQDRPGLDESPRGANPLEFDTQEPPLLRARRLPAIQEFPFREARTGRDGGGDQEQQAGPSHARQCSPTIKSDARVADSKSVKQKGVVGIIGIALVAGVAIYLGRAYLKPATERAQAKTSVLSGAYDVRVEACTILEDDELPEGLEPPAIGSSDRYVQLVVLFPEVTVIKGDKHEYQLDSINGMRGDPIDPSHADIAVEDDGVVLTLTYRTDEDFEYARVVHDGNVIVQKAELG